ncbi:hypothetical protein ACIG0C_10755 [Kitasatospora aureofaciens]|uniref:Uncharacterized protein n=1 Tax=Kitasatospora aureofaciens TaxID=1894 RepID=A0A8H9LMQ8_KITAU|nr:hypothetical protein [Kitasatospora aureofaciens]GGU54465.1 hypothetical protein GCM10010502_00680 [Kitasatospora aureofaciens]
MQALGWDFPAERFAWAVVDLGGEVIATDPKTDTTNAEPVTNTIVGSNDRDFTDLTDADPQIRPRPPRSPPPQSIHTGMRPPSTGLTPVTLKIGQCLRTADGKTASVLQVRSYRTSPRPAYSRTIANLHTYYALAGATPILVHNDNEAARLLAGCDVSVESRMVTNSAGEQVERLTVANEDDLLAIADHLAGGSLDNFANRKPEFWRGTLPNGRHRDIDFNLDGHKNPPEGPRVKLSELENNDLGVSKGNKWKTVLKVFVKGREFR